MTDDELQAIMIQQGKLEYRAAGITWTAVYWAMFHEYVIAASYSESGITATAFPYKTVPALRLGMELIAPLDQWQLVKQQWSEVAKRLAPPSDPSTTYSSP